MAIGAAIGIIMLILVGLALWCMRKQRKEISGLNGVYVMPSSLGSSPRSGIYFKQHFAISSLTCYDFLQQYHSYSISTAIGNSAKRFFLCHVQNFHWCLFS